MKLSILTEARKPLFYFKTAMTYQLLMYLFHKVIIALLTGLTNLHNYNLQV